MKHEVNQEHIRIMKGKKQYKIEKNSHTGFNPDLRKFSSATQHATS